MSKPLIHPRWWKYILEYKWLYLWGGVMVLLTDLAQVISQRSLGWLVDVFEKKPPEFLQSINQQDSYLKLVLIILGTQIFITIGRFGWRYVLGRRTHFAAYMCTGFWVCYGVPNIIITLC